MRNEGGFTLIELMIVIIVAGIMLGAVVIYSTTARKSTDARTAAEMIKQDLRKVYAMAASGDKPAGVDYRYQYRVTFNNNGESPANSYLIERGTPDAVGNYAWAPVSPEKFEAAKIEGNWIKPSSGESTIGYGTNKVIYFFSAGSIVMANSAGTAGPGADMAVTVANGNSITVNISGYGNID
jgi:prepilin-type N-terminal cleavage/methylation domain-containing protein